MADQEETYICDICGGEFPERFRKLSLETHLDVCGTPAHDGLDCYYPDRELSFCEECLFGPNFGERFLALVTSSQGGK